MYWFAAATFVFVGFVALARPEAILAIRTKFRALHEGDPLKERRRSEFGRREVRICGAGLLVISAALVGSLLA